ncbi:MAG: EAL domain-containing protein [Gallionella sp.]|nr:EAL domain-containing protein [Gallionella sp.]MDP1940832.1 EAL domain-containing protein [Gallionella sp.]
MPDTHIRLSLTDPMTVLSVSDDIEAMLGYPTDDLLTGKVSLKSRIHTGDQELAGVLFSPSLEPASGSFNLRLRQASERILCVRLHYSKLTDASGITLELRLEDVRGLEPEKGAQAVRADFSAMMENTDDYIYFKDRNHVFTAASQTLAALAGISGHWTGLIGKTAYDVFPEDYADRYHELEKQMLAGVPVEHVILELRDKNGEMGWFDNRICPTQDDKGAITGLFGTIRDITAYKLAENELRIAATVESQESMMITDADCTILRVNHAFTESTGYTAEEAVGQTPSLLKSGRHDAEFYRAMWESINSTGTWRGEIWDRRKNGKVAPDLLTISAVKSGDVVTHYVGTHVDITERKAAEEEIKHLAFYDQLTGLPNRRLLLDRVRHALAFSARSGTGGALLFIDLDNFRTLNETLGHNVGDLLLQQVAKRLETCVRRSDSVARLGGDEFVVMLEGLSEQALEAAAQTKIVGDKILAVLNQSYRLALHDYRSTPSIGAVLFDDHQQSMDELLKQADIAMYQAKQNGRNTMRFFDPQMQEAVNARAALEDELGKALDKQQFRLFYQVQMDSARRPLGAEALIRWVHPERGVVFPAEFIPLAEETGLIVSIGQWVLETACAQLGEWQKAEHTSELVLSVNASSQQFRQPDFVEQVLSVVQRHAINPARLKLELTESLLLDNIEDTIANMNALKKIGIMFSMDDFGTGYSSLQYLKRLPLDQIKIDQSFVRDIATDSNDSAIVHTIIAMAKSLKMGIIAEGVETAQQRQVILDNGCTHYQGYLFGKPMPIAEFDALLQKV